MAAESWQQICLVLLSLLKVLILISILVLDMVLMVVDGSGFGKSVITFGFDNSYLNSCLSS